MSKEETTPVQATTPEPVVPVTPEVKSENTVPSYRLKEEADRRRTAETELAELKAKEQARADEDLSYKERYDKKVTEFDTFKKDTATKALQSTFVQEATALGFPTKIAKLGAPDNLSEDNMKDSLKAFTKEFAEFLPEQKKEDNKPSSPYAAMQPTAVTSAPTINPANITGQDVMKTITEAQTKQ